MRKMFSYLKRRLAAIRLIQVFTKMCAFFTTILFFAIISNAKAEPLIIGTYDRLEPLAMHSEAILKVAYNKIDIPIEFIELPIRRAFLMMLSEEIDGNLFRIADLEQEHPNLIRLEPPLDYAVVRVYSLNENINITNWDDLKNYKVIFTRGILLIEDNLPEGIRYIDANNNIEAIRSTAGKASDLFLSVETINSPPIPEASKMNLFRLDSVLESVPLYHYLIKTHQKIATNLNKALQEMQTDGSMSAIQTRRH